MTNAPDGAFTPAEGAAILDMTEWASVYRDLHWSIPAMPWPHDRLAGLPVERTNFPGRLDLIGRRSMFEGECVLCTLYRTADGPRVEGIPEAPPSERPSSAPRGVDWSRLVMPAMRVPVVAGLALLVSAPAVAAAPALAPSAAPLPPGVGDDGKPWAPETGGPLNPVFMPPPPGTPPHPSATPPGEGSVNLQEAVKAGERVRAGQDAAAALEDPKPALEPIEVAPEPVVVEDEPEVVDVTPPDAFPAAPEPEPVPLPAPVELVTEAQLPAAPAPPPVKAAEVVPVESEATPERPAGVQDPAAQREAAGHYRAAADLLMQAADAIEAGDAALAGETDPEQSTGQGGGVDTAEDEPGDGDSTEGNDVDLDGARVEIDISDLKVTVNGEAVAVELGGTVEVDTADDVGQPDKAA